MMTILVETCSETHLKVKSYTTLETLISFIERCAAREVAKPAAFDTK
jgi:hypothetical protein